MKKGFIILLVLILAFFAFAGCGSKELTEAVDLTLDESISDNTMRDTMLYYLDENDYMLPVQTKIPWEEGIGKAALNQLVAGKEVDIKLASLGLFPPIPEGVTFDLDIIEGVAKIDVLTNGCEMPTGAKGKRIYKCLASTLLCFESVNEVIINVDGKTMETIGIADLDVLETMANYEPVGSDQSENVQYANLYFITSKGNYLVPVKRLASDVDAVSVVSEMLVPSQSTTLVSAIPHNVDVLSVETSGSVVTIDFSEEFEVLADDPEQQRLTLTAISNSICSIEGISTVQILVEGKEYDGAVETMAKEGFYNILD